MGSGSGSGLGVGLGFGVVGAGSVGTGSVGTGSVGSGSVTCGSVGIGSVGAGGSVSGGFVGDVETVGHCGTGGVTVPDGSVDGVGWADVQPHRSSPHSKKDRIRFKLFTSSI
jgi:hypothetical protein